MRYKKNGSGGGGGGGGGGRVGCGGGRKFFPYQNVQIAFGAHDDSFSMDTVVLSPGVKGPEREVDRPSPNFNCKNELCYTFTPALCVQGLATENPAFIIIIFVNFWVPQAYCFVTITLQIK